MTTSTSHPSISTPAAPGSPPFSTNAMQIEKAIMIKASRQTTWDALLEQLGPGAEGGERGNGETMPMVLEPWPGGRWYRDLGDNAGHFWAHVQVIKPPSLLELHGPLFMSYAAVSHVQYRLSEQPDGTRLAIIHRAIGEIDPDHRLGVSEGWMKMLRGVQNKAESRNA